MSIDQIDPEPAWDDEPPIIDEQPSTWVYVNPRGQIVIRQRQWYAEDEPPFLFFAPENVPKLIAALQEMKVLAEIALAELAAARDVAEPRIEAEAGRRPLTNTERSRRHRERQRNERNEECNGQRNECNENSLQGTDGSDEPALPFDG